MARERLEALRRMRRQPTTAAGPPWSVPRGAVFLVVLLTMACQAATDVEERAGESVPAVIDQGDLPSIRARGTLRVLVGASGEEEFLPRQGMPASLDKTLAEELAGRLGVDMEFVLVDRRDELIPMLVEGKGDLVAAQLTVTDKREQQVAFARPTATVEEWVVGQRGAENLPRSPVALAGREVHVRPSSSFAETLEALQGSDIATLKVVFVEEHLDTESIVYEVTQGKRPLTVVDSHTLDAIQAYTDAVEPLFKIAEGRQIAWAVRRQNPELLAATNTFLVEKSLTGHTNERFLGDLEGIRERGVLRVLTRNNPVTYYLYRGRPMGFDFELAKLIAEDLDVRLAMVVPPSRDQLIPWLLEGRGDIIAASFTITEERGAHVAFSQPYLFVDEMVVSRAGDPPMTTLADLKGTTLHVRRSSSYYDTLERLQGDYGPFTIVEAPENLETEQLIGMVARGEIPLTVSDSHILNVELTYRDEIVGALTLSRGGDDEKAIAFAVRPQNTELAAYLDGFVKKTYRGLEYNLARKVYFEDKHWIAVATTRRTGVSGELSPYDGVIKKYSESYGLDWRLMAAQAFHESGFDPNAKSWVGALGLFQVMPATGQEMGITELVDPPEGGVRAGIMYMDRQIKRMDPTIPFGQRVRFALAAYNAGYGHLIDARRLAAEIGLDPDRWFGNVENAIALLEDPQYHTKARYGYCRGTEPALYVSRIQNTYDNYVKIVQ